MNAIASPGEALLHLSEDLAQLGLSVAALVAHRVANTPSPELAAYRRRVVGRLAAYWKNRSLSRHPVLYEYRRLHTIFGVDCEVAAPEKLLRTIRGRRDLPGSSAVVDCYNIVSARTLLSLGAHDLTRLQTPVTLRQIAARDRFLPLGGAEHVYCAGEYGYVEPGGRVICRLEVLQCEETKVEPRTSDVLFLLQGNAALGAGDLLAGCWLLAEMIETFLGGEVNVVHFEAGRRPA